MPAIHSNTVYELKEHSIITHPGIEEFWDVDVFQQNFKVMIIPQEDISETLEFDLINIDCSFVNAIRRILVAEVSSIAIERVYLHQNTSVMPDEVMSHRLGLIPLAVDPKNFEFPLNQLPSSDNISEFDTKEHLLFDIHVHFSKTDAKALQNKQSKDNTSVPAVRSLPVYSSDLKWVALSGQKEIFNNGEFPAPASSQILINKLAVGDEIEARCLAVKGIGRDHAKFSPVAAAFYKFLPIIKLLRTIEGEEALNLQTCFAQGVIEVNPKTHEAYVANVRLDNGSREHMRFPEFNDKVVFAGTDPSHCIFSVESVLPNFRPPSRLVRSAIDIMVQKCRHYSAIMKTPNFGELDNEVTLSSKVATETNPTTQILNTPSIGRLNGREVGLEVTHISRDKRRATFTFRGEDHTLGSALRFCVLRNKLTTFCGYCVPHPLEDVIYFDIQVKGDGLAIDVLSEGLQCLHDCFVHLKHTFKHALSDLKGHKC